MRAFECVDPEAINPRSSQNARILEHGVLHGGAVHVEVVLLVRNCED